MASVRCERLHGIGRTRHREAAVTGSVVRAELTSNRLLILVRAFEVQLPSTGFHYAGVTGRTSRTFLAPSVK